MRVAIASRIFTPEPSAASFRLAALAAALRAAGHEVTVVTTHTPRGMQPVTGGTGYRVSRFPVLRDRNGYVRGYLQYLSFDVPLFFRLLFGGRIDLVISEPPPTTGFVVRLVSRLRRIPYAYYAADIWSDASGQTGAPGWIVRGVRAVERFALRGARVIYSVSEGVTVRLAELGVSAGVVTIGNGIDVTAFGPTEFPDRLDTPELVFLYAGTASEWHGAGVFVEAFPEVLARFPQARLVFVGGGSERVRLESQAEAIGVQHAVRFHDVQDPEVLGPELRRACAALASVRPGSGYDFAFPTKLYSATVCGAPLIYAGIGPGADFVTTVVEGRPLGESVKYSPAGVSQAMLAAAAAPYDPVRRRTVAHWGRAHLALDSVAARAVIALQRAVEAPR